MQIKRLKELRLHHGYTQKFVAEYIGVSQKAYSNYELGKRKPRFNTFIKFIDLYDVSGDYILGMTDDPSRKIGKHPNHKD